MAFPTYPAADATCERPTGVATEAQIGFETDSSGLLEQRVNVEDEVVQFVGWKVTPCGPNMLLS